MRSGVRFLYLILIGVGGTCFGLPPGSSVKGSTSEETKSDSKEDTPETSIIDLADKAPGAVLFGSSALNSNLLTCTFYDLHRDRRGGIVPMDSSGMNQTLLGFLQKDWKPSMLARFYQSPVKRYSPAVMIPLIGAGAVPAAFGEETGKEENFWMLLYTGTLCHPDGIRFRFRGAADEMIMVRIGDRVVFGDSFNSGKTGLSGDYSKVWKSSDQQTGKHILGNNTASVGDWITLEPGEPVTIRIVAAEVSGAIFSAMLLVEVDGVDYPKNRQGGPILPVFKMNELSFDLLDHICMGLPAGEAALEGGPVFSAAGASFSRAGMEEAGGTLGTGLRIWTGDNGQLIEARFEGVTGVTVILSDVAGNKRRVPINRLSEKDQLFIDQMYNLEHKVAFECLKQERQTKKNHMVPDSVKQESRYEYRFKAVADQVRVAKRSHELREEFYVFTTEFSGSALCLLAREENEFSSLLGAKLTRTMTTDALIMHDELYNETILDEDVFSYLYVIRNASGEVITQAATEKWMLQNLDKMLRIPVGAYVDQSGNRVRPTRPEPTLY